MNRFRMRRFVTRESGTALMVALLLTVIFLGFTMALLGIAISHSTDATTASENLKALFAAEGGLNEAIANLNRGGTGNVVGTINGVAFDARAVHVGDRFMIDSVGTNHEWRRAVRTAVIPALPFPVDRAAIMIVGPAGGAAALDTTSDNHTNVLISGQSGQLPAVGIEDPASYTAVMEDLIPKIVSGEVSSNTFRGTPDTTYTAADGSTASVPIQPLPTPEWDADKLNTLRQALLGKVNTLAASANTVIGAGSTFLNTDHNLSGITVIDGANLDVNANINGSGILIIKGGTLTITDHALLNWDGSIFIVGQNGLGGTLNDSGGHLNVHGNVIVMGNQGSAADLKLGEPNGTGMSNTMIQGAVVLMAGAGSINEQANLSLGTGGVNIHGFIGVFGGAAQVSASNTHGVVNVLGSMVVGVDGSMAEDSRASIDLNGNVHVQYNQNHLDRATAGLLGLVSELMLPPPTYREQGWLEISPWIAYTYSGDALNYTAPPSPSYASTNTGTTSTGTTSTGTTSTGTTSTGTTSTSTSSTSTSSTSTSTSPSSPPSTSTSPSTGGQGALVVGNGNGNGGTNTKGKGNGS